MIPRAPPWCLSRSALDVRGDPIQETPGALRQESLLAACRENRAGIKSEWETRPKVGTTPLEAAGASDETPSRSKE